MVVLLVLLQISVVRALLSVLLTREKCKDEVNSALPLVGGDAMTSNMLEHLDQLYMKQSRTNRTTTLEPPYANIKFGQCNIKCIKVASIA
mmetsp:Transcript_14897/g.21255  ORF Transcript_14897/g.21255 Transcript_14897/m.21255 type:complete len:90 (+) Transcript_14897:154-423(+)